MSTAVPETSVSSDEDRAWIVMVATFLNRTLDIRFAWEALPPSQVGRYRRTAREVVLRIGVELEDEAWFLEQVLDSIGIKDLFLRPEAPLARVLHLVPKTDDPARWSQTVYLPGDESGPTRQLI